MYWVAGCHIWDRKIVYTGFGIVLYAAVMLLRFFSAVEILPNPKLKNKRKIFIGGFSKQYGFPSQRFLVVRGKD